MPELNIAVSVATPSITPPAVILLGRDDAGRPHASRFEPSEAGSAASAAALMGMHVLEAGSADLDRIARQLPRGRVFGSGKAFVPFVNGSLYDKLVTHLQTSALVKPVRAVSPAGDSDDGMAIAPKAGNASTASEAASAEGAAAKALAPGQKLDPSDQWAKLKVSDLVLALDNAEGGWFEATVTEIMTDDSLKLKWRDFPVEAAFTRRRWNVGLLHPRQGRP